jgi:hypothetical protein
MTLNFPHWAVHLLSSEPYVLFPASLLLLEAAPWPV